MSESQGIWVVDRIEEEAVVLVEDGTARTVEVSLSLMSVSVDEVPWDQLLDELCHRNGLAHTVVATLLVVAEKDKFPGGRAGRFMAPQPAFSGDEITVRLSKMPLKDVAPLFELLAELDIAVDPSASAELVTIDVVDVPWDQLLNTILWRHELVYVKDKESMRIAAVEILVEEGVDSIRKPHHICLHTSLCPVHSSSPNVHSSSRNVHSWFRIVHSSPRNVRF